MTGCCFASYISFLQRGTDDADRWVNRHIRLLLVSRLLAVLIDYWLFLRSRKRSVRIWALAVLSTLVILPVLELSAYQLVIDTVSAAHRSESLSRAHVILLCVSGVTIIVLEVVAYFAGLMRVRLVNYLVTLQRRILGVRDRYDGWARAVASEAILGLVLTLRLLVLGIFAIFVFELIGLFLLAGIFIGLVVLFRQFGIELLRQSALSAEHHPTGKALASLRLVSRIESSELASLSSSVLVYVMAIAAIFWSLKSGQDAETLLLLVLMFRFLASGMRTLAGSYMRLSRAMVGAGLVQDIGLGEEATVKHIVRISRWSRLNRFERLQDDLNALEKRFEKVRFSRNMWRDKAKALEQKGGNAR